MLFLFFFAFPLSKNVSLRATPCPSCICNRLYLCPRCSSFPVFSLLLGPLKMGLPHASAFVFYRNPAYFNIW